MWKMSVFLWHVFVLLLYGEDEFEDFLYIFVFICFLDFYAVKKDLKYLYLKIILCVMNFLTQHVLHFDTFE